MVLGKGFGLPMDLTLLWSGEKKTQRLCFNAILEFPLIVSSKSMARQITI